MASSPEPKRNSAEPGRANVVPLRPKPEPNAAPACPLAKCDGTGWLETEGDAVKPCDCRSIRGKGSRARGLASAIPARYRGVSFDRPPISDMARAPESRAVVSVVHDFVDDIKSRVRAGDGLWIMGDVGTGKTTLAMLVSKSAIQAGHSVAIYSLPRLLYRIRHTFDSADLRDSYESFFKKLISVDLLHIDDLGAEKRSDWVLEQLYAIVDERYQAQRSMIVTSNNGFEELAEQIGPRVVSRLTEMCQELPLYGDDKRNAFSA